MSEGKELKLTEEAFTNTVSKLREYKNVLISTLNVYTAEEPCENCQRTFKGTYNIDN